MNPYEITVNAQRDGTPIAVEVHHYHHYIEDDQQPSTNTSGLRIPSGVDSIVGKRVRILTDASAVNVDGSVGCFLGVDDEGALGSNYGPTSERTVWSVHSRDTSADGHALVALQSPLSRHFLRINAKGDMDARGGGGRWTLFAPQVQGHNLVTLRSLANSGKANLQGTTDWFLAMHGGKLVGNGAAFSFPFQVEGPIVEAVKRDHRPHQHHHHHHGGPKSTAQFEARKEAKEKRFKEKQERQAKKALSSGWTVVGGGGEARAAAPAFASPTTPEPNPAVVPATTKTAPKAKGFPTGITVTLMPVAFAEMQNRKGTTGWHLGIAPMGFVVPDASAGGWSQLRSLPGPDGTVIFESLHTPAFHLAIRADLQLTHKGGKGKFAQWLPIPAGKYWSFRCMGHEKEVFLAVSASGVPYAANEHSKDTRFKLDQMAAE